MTVGFIPVPSSPARASPEIFKTIRLYLTLVILPYKEGKCGLRNKREKFLKKPQSKLTSRF